MAIIANDNPVQEVSFIQRDELMSLLNTSSYEGKVYEKLIYFIETMESIEEYQALKDDLWRNQIGIDSAINPSQKEINAHIRKIARI